MRPGKINSTGKVKTCFSTKQHFFASVFTIKLILGSYGSTVCVRVHGPPVSAGICVSPKKLRQIDDPVHRLLAQLHKIIYVTQVRQQYPDENHVRGSKFL